MRERKVHENQDEENEAHPEVAQLLDQRVVRERVNQDHIPRECENRRNVVENCVVFMGVEAVDYALAAYILGVGIFVDSDRQQVEVQDRGHILAVGPAKLDVA